MNRLFLKCIDALIIIGYDDTKSAGLLDRHRHCCYGHICIVFLVEIKHHLIVHLVNMVSRQYQHIVRVVTVYIPHILVDCIGCTCVPLAVAALLIRRQYCHSSVIPVEVPRNTYSDVAVKSEWLILCKYPHCINA